jgi:hypothetical protein
VISNCSCIIDTCTIGALEGPELDADDGPPGGTMLLEDELLLCPVPSLGRVGASDDDSSLDELLSSSDEDELLDALASWIVTYCA